MSEAIMVYCGASRISGEWTQEREGDHFTRSPVILVVDDDPAICEIVCQYLEDHQLSAASALNGTGLRQRLATSEPCLILLDLSLGRESGLDLLREIRKSSDVPVIIMSGHHLEESDRVSSLELGADDYIAKPFGLRELMARVRAVLRRGPAGDQRSPRRRGTYGFNGWQFDCSNRKLSHPDRGTVSLSKREYALLLAFIDAPGMPLSREYLLHAAGVDEDTLDRCIDSQVVRLRRKVELDPTAPEIIRTDRGFGYIFACSVDRH
jgi:two-component system OmpR family response regulator